MSQLSGNNVGKIVYDPALSEKIRIYRDRRHAGKVLAEFMRKNSLIPDIVMAIPAGGVPVALEIAKTLGVKMDLVIVKKVLYPWTTEAGFGAVGPMDTVVLGPSPLTEEEIVRQVEEAKRKVEEREIVLRRGKPYPHLDGLRVAVVDDGIAAGYTMLTAVRFVKKLGASEVWAAAPTSSYDGARLVAQEADLVIVPNIRSGPVFAVADAYEHWYDLSEEEVLELLKEAEELGLLVDP